MTPDFRDRMREALGQPVAEGHPTADVLNAYAERALTAPEAQQVLQHLSTCAECREVVYLASEAHEEPVAAPVATASKKIRWWVWAVPAVAAIVAVSTALLVQPHRVNYIAQTTKQEAPLPPPAAPAQTHEPEAESPRRPSPAVVSKPSAPVISLQKDDKDKNLPADVPPPALDAVARLNTKGAPIIPQAAPVQRRDSYTFETRQASPAITPDAVGGVMAADALVDRDRIEVPQTNSTEAAKLNSTVGMALPSVQSGTAARSKKTLFAAPWRVTHAGTLEHLTGGEWKALTAGPDAQVVAVTNFGPNVWAAAKNLQLYHSGNDGQHWERQNLPAEAQGEIVRLTFRSELDGALQTSTGDLWSTHDGGKTWSKANRVP
jgi:hypothetical protein